MTLIGGLPAHPLVIHAVVVLLPLAALGTLLIAVRPSWRRHLGIPVFLVALVGVIAVPVATTTGEQLEQVIGTNPLIAVHAQRAGMLLPYAVLFVVLLLATLLLGWRADQAENGGQARSEARLTTAVGALSALAGLAVAGLVIWIGHAGATAVWQGVVST